MPKVFISYSHDSLELEENVKNLADTLIKYGVQAEIDQYTPNPKQGWPQYMLENIISSDYVLCVCSETYKKRFENDELVGVGLGAKFEGKYITQILYSEEYNRKIIPVIFTNDSVIPFALQPYTHYRLYKKGEFEKLYGYITDQPLIERPDLGGIVSLNKDNEKLLTNITFGNNQKQKKILTMSNEVYARSITRFKTNGVDRNTAAKLIEKDLNSNKFDYILNNQISRLIFLCGEFGVGKSYAIDILFLKQAKLFLSNLENRLPIYLKANSLESIKEIIEKEYLYDKDEKYVIFIDGLDEVDYGSAGMIIDELMLLEELWSNSYFVITTRPISLVNNIKVEYLPVLCREEIVEIIECITEKISDSTIGFRLDKEILKAIERPFFCILFALNMKENGMSFIFDRNRMIDYLVNKSISNLSKQKEKLYEQLIRLSVICIDNKLGKVHISDLGNDFDIVELSKSGLVYKDNNEYINFPLPIIPQWLSAEGLRLNHKDINDIIKSEEQIIKWRYPLSISFGKMAYNESKNIFGKIICKYPGVASIILREGITTVRQSDLPTPYECGEMLQECMKKWIEGLGDLSYLIAPYKNGKLADLGVDIDGRRILVSWNSYTYNEKIITIESEQLLDWGGNVRSHVPVAQSIWPWIDTFDYLSDNLEKLVKLKPLIMADGILLEEYIWSISCKLTNRGSLYDDLISLSEIESFRKFSHKTHMHIKGIIVDMNFYFNEIDELIERGISFINAPWPKQDVPDRSNGGWVWDNYSDQRILEKTTFIYESAIKEYLRLIDKWFPLIKENLSLYNLLPAKLSGDIRISRQNGYNGGPILDWYFEVLPKGNDSYVSFELSNDKSERNMSMDNYSQILKELRAKRREKSEWIHFSSGSRVLNIFGDKLVTNLVFEWLKSDLKNIGLIK